MTIHLTVPGVLAAMTAAVEARGRDYVYEPLSGLCLYVSNGCVSCLIGATLARCGVPLPDMAEFEGRMADRLLAGLLDFGAVTYDEGVPPVLRAAQHVQDGYGVTGNAGTWGEALDAAVVAARAVAS